MPSLSAQTSKHASACADGICPEYGNILPDSGWWQTASCHACEEPNRLHYVVIDAWPRHPKDLCLNFLVVLRDAPSLSLILCRGKRYLPVRASMVPCYVCDMCSNPRA